MFGISNMILLKNNILDILEHTDGYLSTTELTRQIGSASLATVKKACTRLKATIDSVYTQKEVTLDVNRHYGIRLSRHTVTVQDIMQHIFSTDLAYQILWTVLLERECSTTDFCNLHYISESQLRRKVRTINSFLANYDLKISLYSKIKINGKERKIRAFHFIFLLFFHRQLSKIPYLKNDSSYLAKAEKVARYLMLGTGNNQTGILGLWIFVIQNAIEKNKTLVLSTLEENILKNVEIKDIPDCLSGWSYLDWIYLVFSVYSSDFYKLDLSVHMNNVHQTIRPGNTLIWIELFEKYFTKLDKRQIQFIYEKFFKFFISETLFVPDEAIISVFRGVDFGTLQNQYPKYLDIYESFWKEYCSRADKFTSEFFKIDSLMTCIYLAPFCHYFPEINVFIVSDMTAMYTKYIEEYIKTHFSNRYMLHFIDSIDKADVIIGTIDLSDHDWNKTPLFVKINLRISLHDLANIEKAIKAHLSNKKQ
ncbi:helix-turn-helix domain-containing protein [Christensenella timonensis]|uniref:helix-turn-helix domain-containing protein n=1 Tax=Christensenella timonensis TaxID=1816678 RepID=UPI00082F6A0D|nr:helix-turn-helix domain-containing protein [Christensenella timonensis]